MTCTNENRDRMRGAASTESELRKIEQTLPNSEKFANLCDSKAKQQDEPRLDVPYYEESHCWWAKSGTNDKVTCEHTPTDEVMRICSCSPVVQNKPVCTNHDRSKCEDSGNDCCIGVGKFPEDHRCKDGYKLVETKGRCEGQGNTASLRQYSCIPANEQCQDAVYCTNHDNTKCEDTGNDCCVGRDKNGGEDRKCRDGFQLRETSGSGSCSGELRMYSCIPREAICQASNSLPSSGGGKCDQEYCDSPAQVKIGGRDTDCYAGTGDEGCACRDGKVAKLIPGNEDGRVTSPEEGVFWKSSTCVEESDEGRVCGDDQRYWHYTCCDPGTEDTVGETCGDYIGFPLTILIAIIAGVAGLLIIFCICCCICCCCCKSKPKQVVVVAPAPAAQKKAAPAPAAAPAQPVVVQTPQGRAGAAAPVQAAPAQTGPTPTPLQPYLYRVVHKSGAMAREGYDTASPQVHKLVTGDQVTVVEVVERRARIIAPANGWISIATADGTAIATMIGPAPANQPAPAAAPAPAGLGDCVMGAAPGTLADGSQAAGSGLA